MSFLVSCPNCGPRSAYEFEFGGEYQVRPEITAPFKEWTQYLHLRKNSTGIQSEWWYHRQGCRLWFLAQRNTSTNQIKSTFWPDQLESEQPSKSTNHEVNKAKPGDTNDQN